MMKKSIFLLFAFFVLLIGVTPLQAQITDTAEIPEPTAISILDLNAQIELATQQLKNIDKKTEVPQLITTIDSLLPIYQLKLQERTKAFHNFKNSHPNKVKVVNLINKWGNYDKHLSVWQKNVNGHLNKNTTLLEQLNRQNKQWLLTYQNAQKENVPFEVIKLVRETRKTLNSLIIKLNEQNRHIISLETHVLILKENITTVLDDLDTWKQSEEFSILYQRHPSIWNLDEETLVSKDKSFNPWQSFKENLRGVYIFLISPENNLSFILILILLLSLWSWRIKRSFSKMQIGEKDNRLIQYKKVVINHFFYSIVFLSVIVSIIYFTQTPNLLNEFLLLTALICAIPIVKPIIHDQFKNIIYFILILFILNTLKSYVWYSSTFYRVYLFIEAALAILFILKLTYPYIKTRRLQISNVSLMFVKLTPVLYLLYVSSIVFNILGYTNFTDFLLKVGAMGGVLITVLLGMLIILRGFSMAAIHYHYSRLEKYDIQNKLFIEKRTNQWITAFSYVFTAVYFLHVIDVYQYWTIWLTDFLSEPNQAGTITFTWGSIFTFLIILIGSFSLTSFIARIIDGGALSPLKLPKGIPAIISIIIRYFIIAFAIIVAFSMVGVELGEFNLMAGALGLGIGFGLQNIIANFISGIILIFERPVQIKDVIEVGTLLGEVKKIGVRSSNIRTFNGAEVVVPNSNLISNEVINWTLSDNIKRIEIKIGAAYGTDLQKVVDILKETALGHENVLNTPVPAALFDEFGDSSLNFRLLYWVPVDFGISTKSEVSIAVYNRFKAEGIKIPFPQRDVNFKKEDLDALKGKAIKSNDNDLK